MMNSILRLPALLLCITVLATTLAEAQTSPSRFTAPALVQASTAYAQAMKFAQDRYVAALDAALSTAMKDGNLQEANAVNAVKTAVAGNTPPPETELKNSKANEAKRAYEAGVKNAKSTYITILQNALKPVLASGKLAEANAIQDEIRLLEGASVKTAESTSANETADLAVSGSGFTISTIQENAPAFGNRGYVWQEVPAAIKGWRYTKINGGTRAEIKVKAKQETVVHAATDLTDPGVKMTGWDRTGMHFTYNNGKGPDMVLYKKKLSAGQEIEVPQGNWCGVIVFLPTK